VDDWKVLLVDDEEEFVITLAERLQIRGIQTLTQTNGQGALDSLASEKPQVVVLDIMMPGISGMDVLRHIKQHYPEIQVILLTGRGNTRESAEGIKLGAFDFMIKPVKIEDLISKLFEAMDKPKHKE